MARYKKLKHAKRRMLTVAVPARAKAPAASVAGAAECFLPVGAGGASAPAVPAGPAAPDERHSPPPRRSSPPQAELSPDGGSPQRHRSPSRRRHRDHREQRGEPAPPDPATPSPPPQRADSSTPPGASAHTSPAACRTAGLAAAPNSCYSSDEEFRALSPQPPFGSFGGSLGRRSPAMLESGGGGSPLARHPRRTSWDAVSDGASPVRRNGASPADGASSADGSSPADGASPSRERSGRRRRTSSRTSGHSPEGRRSHKPAPAVADTGGDGGGLQVPPPLAGAPLAGRELARSSLTASPHGARLEQSRHTHNRCGDSRRNSAGTAEA